MKLALNGALTVGTLDGANIEIREAVGPENFFLFGMTAEEAAARRPGYNPWEVYRRDPTLQRAIDLVRRGFFSSGEPRLFAPLLDALLPPDERPGHGDEFMVLADFADYAACQERIGGAYRDPAAWQRMALLNIAGMGPFSSDRAVQEYAGRIWGAAPVPVTLSGRL